MPTYFSTGTWDVLVHDKGVVKDYKVDPVAPKVLSDRKRMTHYTDSILGRNFLLGYYMAFLQCEAGFMQSGNECEFVYGAQEGSLCNNKRLKLVACETQRSSQGAQATF